ncbi:MAG: hypothetical protein ACI8PZ_003271 [Myxococcota bacterium]|jgi:hypothetical protein
MPTDRVTDSLTADQIDDVLKEAFPDGESSEGTRTGLFNHLGGTTKVAPVPVADGPRDPAHKYYEIQSIHDRHTPKKSEFVGVVQTVRVTLRDKRFVKLKERGTLIGRVKKSDHLLKSIQDIRNKYGDKIDGDFTRVDLITPARHNLDRFAPLALYLGYRKENSKAPFFYIMESGNALGQSKVLYLSPTMESGILQKGGYKPSPFSDPNHIYKGTLVMDGDEPQTATIDVYKNRKATDPMISITAKYTRKRPSEVIRPIAQQIQAVERINAINKYVFGTELKKLGDDLAELGLKLQWTEFPVRTGKNK